MVGGSMRTVRNISTGAVALIAAFSSYSHTVHVALRFAERPEVAYALPVSVDGMLVVATVVMADDRRHGNRARPIARIAFAAGVAASLAANIAAAHSGVGARLVAAWPAVALLLVVEMLAHPPAPTAGQARPATADHHQPPVAAATTQPPQLPPHIRRQPATPTAGPYLPPGGAAQAAPRATPASDSARSGRPIEAVPATGSNDHVRARRGGLPGPAAVTTPKGRPWATDDGTLSAPVKRANTDRAKPAPAAARRRRPAALTRQLARQIIDTEPELTRAQIAGRLGLSTRRLREILNQPP